MQNKKPENYRRFVDGCNGIFQHFQAMSQAYVVYSPVGRSFECNDSISMSAPKPE
jgi:hypothetical protein